MAIRTLPKEGRYSNNKSMGGGGTEPRRKLKKLRSVKVANLDRLRLSMKREGTRFITGSSAAEPSSSSTMIGREKARFTPGSSSSESSSSPMSGTYSPSYMRATTSSSSRKASSSKTPEGRDPASLNVPVDIKLGKRIKRTASMKRTNKLSSMKSMKIRAKYSQFPDVDNVNSYCDQEGMIKGEPNQKGLLERSLSRSRSIRLMRLKSLRSSRQKSRFGGGGTVQKDSEAESSNAKPHYMKATGSQEARKDSEKGSTRTSSLRPLRILAKIPSLRPRRSKAMKPPEVGPLPGVNILRATCSSVLKTYNFPDHIQVNPGGLESERFSSFHICPYNYCSLHGHQHHAPSPPLKEFISAKRQLVRNQRGKQLENHSREEVVHSKSVKEINHLRQTIDTESPEAQEVINSRKSKYQVEEETDMDFLNDVYAKPRKKWDIEGSPREQAEALSNSDHTDLNFGGYEWKLEDILGGTSRPHAGEEALTEGKLAFTERNIKSSDKTQNQAIKFEESDLLSVKLPDSGHKSSLVDKTLKPFIEEAVIQSSLKNHSVYLSTNSESSSGNNSSLVDKTIEPFIEEAGIQSPLNNHSVSLSTNSESSSGDLTSIISDKQKYLSIWHMIYQEFVPSEESMSKDHEIRGIGERERGDSSTVQKMDELELRESKHDPSIDNDEDNQGGSMEKTAFDQTAAINLVQEALNAILEREAIPDPHSPAGEQMEQVHEANEGTMPGQKMSKNWSKVKKVIVTAKFIKAMEKLTKISPGKLRFLLPETTSEEERVYLRHLSMNERKYEEEWMLDFALRRVISQLAPEQQKRVGLLVEAFETFDPENKEKKVKVYPVKRETAPGIELVTSMDEEPKQLIESKQGVSMSEEQVPKKQDDGLTVYLTGAPEDKNLSQDHGYEASAKGDKILQEAEETSTFSESPRNSSTTSIDRGFEEPSRGSEERMRTPKVAPEFQTSDLAVYPAGDMVMVLFDRQKYSSIWNMIYEHVSSEKDKEYNDDLNSTPSNYSTDREEDEDNCSVSGEKQELSKSAAVKLVKEAVNAILQRYDPSSDQQLIKDRNTASDSVKKLATPTPTNSYEENFREGRKMLDKEDTHPEAKVLEKSDASQKQVEENESKAPPKKMSKSLNKLRKAIVTAKFIKAMEKLRKINPQKPRHLSPVAASEEERVNLRHLSMNGRNNSEEWMLDYALRKVITKLDPDQQRRVALLVEAFETVNPEQTEKGIRLADPTNKEPKEFVGPEQQRPISDEHVLHKQDDGFVPSSEVIPKQRGLQEAHDPQASTEDEKTQQETGKAVVSSYTFESTKNSSRYACVDVAHEELSIGDKEMTATREVSSQCRDSEVGTAGDITSILSDKTKYNSMWNLIYQHVVPREASRAGKHGDNEVHENEHDEDAINAQQMKDPDASVRNESTNQKKEESNQSAAGKQRELDQSAAIKMVHEAINTILQCSEPEDRLHKEANENALSQKKVEESEVKVSQRDSRKSISKLKKLFITVKFMKAMERMRRISPQKPGYLSHEAASEEERVCLRHQDINARRNAEEWMLDYALRNVISNLAPEQQRRVALLVEAFQTITPEQKGTSSRNFMKVEVAPATELGTTQSVKLTTQSEHDNSTSNGYDYHIHSNAGDKFSLLGEVIQLKRSTTEEYPMEISNFKTKLHEEVVDSYSQGCPVVDPLNALKQRKERDSNSKSEPLKVASLSKNSEQDCEENITQGILSDKQKHTSMWSMIYQHAKSAKAVEAVSSPSDIVASKDQLESGNPSDITVDGDTDDSDASSVTSELGESDAISLVRDAINDILVLPQEFDNGLFSSNTEAASNEDKRAGGEEKTVSTGYSKLKKLVICNKFIKAMEKAKMRKSYPQKWENQILNSGPEAEKAKIKCCSVGEAKYKGELVLDHALQKVIAELAPVQQKRVALLVEAFEKVNPDTEETGKRISIIGTESLSSATHAKGTKDRQVLGDFDLKQQGSVTTSTREVATDSALEEIHGGDTPEICREDCRNNSPSSIAAATSNVCKVPTDINCRDILVCRIQQKLTSDDVNNSEPPGKAVEKPSRPEDLLEDEGNPSTENDTSVDKGGNTSLWNLLVQYVKSDILDETEKQKTREIAASGGAHGAYKLLGKNKNYAGEVNHDEDINVQIPRTMSFEIQEKEAIKVVEEALDEILTCQDQSMTTSTVSDPYGSTGNNGFTGESSPATEETEGLQPLTDYVAKPKEEQELAKEKSSNTYSQLSKVILCKRFITAMDKMREIKAQGPVDHNQKILSEEKSLHPMRQTASDHRKNWEEWMLDHAMQQVIGKLAPVQKKKVSLLVQAFEKVSSQPEPSTGKKGKAAGS